MTLNDRFRGVCPLISVITLFMVAGCTADQYSRQADRTANRILARKIPEFSEERRESVVYPEEKPPQESIAEPPEPASTAPEVAGEEALKITLIRAIELALEGNRGYMDRLEGLYIEALGLVGTRHSFSPQVSAALSYLFSDGTGSSRSHNAGLSLSVSQDLFYGGSLSLSGNTSFDATHDSSLDDPNNFSSSIGIQLSQSLLRGAGRLPGMEALVQAERSMVYAIRDFELHRQDFSINVAKNYYNIVQQLQSIDNSRKNLDSVVFTRRQAEAFFDVGLKGELEVLRARRSELTARNSLIEAEERVERAVDEFKIFLGLSRRTPIEIIPEEPEFIPVTYDVRSAVEIAFANRLDYLNQKERLEDAERSLRLSQDNLLPNLDLSLGYSVSAAADPSFAKQRLDNRSYSAGLSLEIPLDRVTQRNSYRQAEISYRQAVRSFEVFEDNLVVEIESAIRELDRRVKSLEIQRLLIVDQEKQAKVAQIRFEEGEISNRDLVEAQQDLLDARNALVQEKVNYEITRLGLLRKLGILFIDEKGMWVE